MRTSPSPRDPRDVVGGGGFSLTKDKGERLFLLGRMLCLQSWDPELPRGSQEVTSPTIRVADEVTSRGSPETARF